MYPLKALNEGHWIVSVNLRGMYNSGRPQRSVTFITAIKLHQREEPLIKHGLVDNIARPNIKTKDVLFFSPVFLRCARC